MLLQAKKDYYNNLIAESSTVLHRFAVFFTDKVCKISHELPDLSRHQLNIRTPAQTCSLNVFPAVTESEVHKIIANSPTKSCSLDPAPTTMVKDSVDELIP